MDPISAIAALVTSVVSRVWPDKSESAKQAFTLEVTKELNNNQVILKQFDIDQEQIKTNSEQAKNENLFISGPRPFIMWGTGIILVFYFFLATITSFGVALGFPMHQMPPLDPMLRDIILGLLGLGYITRSVEKLKGK